MNEIRFTIPANLKANSCAANEGARFSLTCYALLTPNKQLICTNGRVLSAVPFEVQGEVPGPVFLPAKPLAALSNKEANVSVNGDIRVTRGKDTKIHDHIDDEGRYPGCKMVMPKPETVIKDYMALSIDAEMLLQLAEAISTSRCVTLLIPKPKPNKQIISGAIAVVGMDSDSHEPKPMGIGAIMPLAIERMDSGDSTPRLNARRKFYAEQVEIMPGDTIRLEKKPKPTEPINATPSVCPTV